MLVNEASGVHRNLQRGLEALGHEVVLVMPGARSYQGRAADMYFDWPRGRLTANIRGKVRDAVLPEWSVRRLPHADVANFVNALSLFTLGRNRYRDLPVLRKDGCMVGYYGVGCDEVSLMRVRPDNASLPCPSCEAFDRLGQACRQDILRHRGRARGAATSVDFIVSSAYEFAHCHDFFPGGAHDDIPLPVAVDAIEFVGAPEEKARPLIIHAPTRRGFKGTDRIIEAVGLLRAKGVRFDFELVEGVGYSEFLRTMARADVVVDQVLSRGYGMAALECLAMGKVVVSGLAPETRRFFEFASTCPIVDAPADPQRLCEVIGSTLARRDEFATLGARGRDYVAQHHGHVAIARRFAALWTGKERQESRARTGPRQLRLAREMATQER